MISPMIPITESLSPVSGGNPFPSTRVLGPGMWN